MTYLSHTEELDSRPAAVNGAFLGFNLLEADIVLDRIEISKRWPRPLLIFLGVVLLQAADILREFLELLLKLAFWLTGAGNAAGSALRRGGKALDRCAIESSFLRRIWRRDNVASCIRRLHQSPLHGRSRDDSRHFDEM